MTEKKPKVRPLLVRDGVHYTCSGLGLCCTDIHELGPLTRPEVVDVKKLKKDAVIRSAAFDEPMLRTKGGRCVFLRKDMLCDIHAKHGPEKKPAGCRRFPLGLSATPLGGRVTTRHCCACRTLGERPALVPEAAEPSIVDSAGRLQADRHVTSINLGGKKRVSFARWVEIEAELFARLRAGEKVRRLLEAEPFPELRKMDWEDVLEQCYEDMDDTQFDTALAWFGDAIGAAVFKRKPKIKSASSAQRPWAWALEKAAKSGPQQDPKAIFREWLADDIWSLEWTDRGSFARARLDIVTRYDIAKRIMKRLKRLGVREDVAAAEGVLIVDLISSSEFWEDVIKQMPPKSLTGTFSIAA